MKDSILKATEVADRHGTVYCIGSYGRHVNFRAQQNRALNLVWALHADGRFEEGHDIAVIGGGVTGLTAAAAFISRGCRVDLFESGLCVLPRQTGTEHRFVHPTINSWPGQRLSLTTELPFLEWHVGQCNTIIDKLSRQFERLRPPDSKFFRGERATAINDIATGVVQVKTSRNTMGYQLVVIAVGFGEERTFAPFPPFEYWEQDNLERDRNLERPREFIVSGCGDGGLIDALRIAHFDFDKGMLAFRAAAELAGSEAARIVQRGEAAAARQTDDAKMTAELKTAYEAAATLVRTDPDHADLARALKYSLSRFPGIVHLTDTRWDPCFSPSAAPIHKLLVEITRQEGSIRYKFGPVTETEDNVVVGGQLFPPRPTTRVIIRHGADPRPTLLKLLTVSEVDLIEEKQATADFLGEKLWSDDFPAMHGAPRRDPTAKSFHRDRFHLAEEAVQTIGPRAKLVYAANGYKVHYKDMIPAMAPTSLFGIPTESAARPIAPSI